MKLTHAEFLEILEQIWPTEDEKEDERLLDESFEEGLKEEFGDDGDE